IFSPTGSKHGSSFAARILEPLGLPANKLRKVSLSMSCDRQADQQAYQRTAKEIAAELRRGTSVAWITEGDPLFYSTFIHLYEQMRRHFPEVRIEIIPGVSSIHAAAARAGVPIAHLDEKVAVVPAAYGLDRLPELLGQFATVFL